jgi:hypothetical protein
MHKPYHIDRCVETLETSSVQVGRVPALLDVEERPGELGVVGHQKNAGILAVADQVTWSALALSSSNVWVATTRIFVSA